MSEWEAVGATVRTRRNADGTGGMLVAEASPYDEKRAETARLIAAAPELLDAARLVDQADGTADSRADYEQKMGLALRAVRAAIAKTEGRS